MDEKCGYMKSIIRNILLIAIFITVPGMRGQSLTNLPKPHPDPLPGWFTNIPAGFSNAFNNLSNSFGWGKNFWWTNSTSMPNSPCRAATNTSPGHSVSPNSSAPSKLPMDVRTIVQQFQQERRQLIKDLNGANDVQRQQILQQLEALRQQIIGQLQNIRANLSQQTLEMQAQFN